MITITLKDGTKMECEKGTKIFELACAVSEELGKKVLGAKIGNKIVEAGYELNADESVELLTFDDMDGKHIYWHTTSHIMAQAVKRLYPETKLAIGPAIDTGFYYDFESDTAFTPEDLEKIEK